MTPDELRERERLRGRIRRGRTTCRELGCPEIAPYNKQYCQRHCARPSTIDGVCARCGALVNRRRSYSGQRVYCTVDCMIEAKRLDDSAQLDRRVTKWKRHHQLWIYRCRNCDKRIIVRGTSARRSWCSKRCWLDHQSAKVMGLYYADTKRGAYWRAQLVQNLRGRDGDDCWLCGGVMNFGTATGPRGGDPDGATIEHVVPRSKGGGDESSNLRLTHWVCNQAKRDD